MHRVFALIGGLAALALAIHTVPAAAQGASKRGIAVVEPSAVQKLSFPEDAKLQSAERLWLNKVVEAGASFRTLMASDPAKLRAALDPDERDALDQLVNVESQRSLARWRYFFRGSVAALGHATSDRPVLGFYNPIADAWVILETARSTKGGVAVKALTAVSGEQINGRKRAGDRIRPHWIMREDLPAPTALAFSTGAAITRFEQRYPVMLAKPQAPSLTNEKALVARRLDLLGVTVATFRSDRPYQKLEARIRSLIADGDGRGLARMTPRPEARHHRALMRLKLLGKPVRETFHLVGTFRHEGGMLAAFSSPFNAQWLVFADIDASDGAPRVSDMVAIDLSQLL